MNIEEYSFANFIKVPFKNSENWNPVPTQHKGVILIPKEKLN